MPSLRRRSCLAAATLLLLAGCNSEVRTEGQRKPDPRLRIYYIWTAEGDPHQHSSIKTGVEKAFAEDKVKELLGDKVAVEGRVDPASKEKSIELARELLVTPGTLAVIGHTYSGTTWYTLPIFAEAGVPVLITNATSPYLLLHHSENEEPTYELTGKSQPEEGCKDTKGNMTVNCYFVFPGTENHPETFRNALRLVSADVPDQASAVQLTIAELSHSTDLKPRSPDGEPRVMLICDQTSHGGARIYSKPMCDYLERFTTHRDPNLAKKKGRPDYRIVSSRNVNLDHGDLWGLVTEIRAVRPDYIVLVGYSELARDVLEGLAERDPLAKYVFILTDGSFSDTLHAVNPNARLYFTSPAHPHTGDTRCDAVEAGVSDLERKRQSEEIPETTEALAHDSLVLLAHAVSSCSSTVDRACILKFLHQPNRYVEGTCEIYDFHEGEQQDAAYYVYSESERKPNGQFEPQWCASTEDTSLRPYEACGRK